MNKISKLIISTIIIIFYLTNSYTNEDTKLKIGLLIPISGENYELGQSIIKAVRMAMKDINTDKLEIVIKDTKSDPAATLKSANELKLEGINLTIGPVFFESLKYLDEIEDMVFLSFTNQTINLPKNVISSGVNSTSQLNTIKKFLEDNEIDNTIFLIPKLNYEEELKKVLKNLKLKFQKLISMKKSQPSLQIKLKK